MSVGVVNFSNFLTGIKRTVDGSSFAFSELIAQDKGVVEVNKIAEFKQLRHIDLSRNKVSDVL
jgi:hypothetical protein